MGASAAFRRAVREDVPLILRFIRALAAYEHLSHEVTADEAVLDEWLLHNNRAW